MRALMKIDTFSCLRERREQGQALSKGIESACSTGLEDGIKQRPWAAMGAILNDG